MTVSGILAGLTNPLGSGFALSRAAASVKAVSPAKRRDHDADGQAEQTEGAAERASRFDTQDIVDLSKTAANAELSDDEKKQVDELKKRDTEVRAHEQAHLSAAGSNARGGASFDYQTGPDGHRYAVGGEVQIDTSPVKGDPQATIQKMQQIRAAALAPGDPSSQDRSVAAQAAAAIQQAHTDQAAQKSDSDAEGPGDTDPAGESAEHESGAQASVAAQAGLQNAVQQFARPKGPDAGPTHAKITSPNSARGKATAFSTERPRSDFAAGEILDLVA